MRRTSIILVTLLALTLAGCRQEQQQTQQINSFRTETPRSTAATPAETKPAETATQKTDTPINLLKQRVGRGTSEILLERKGYITSYNKQRRTPNWVAWTLTKQHTYGNLLRENERFEEDFDVPEPRATFQDYYNSRYDRGHMCPAGDNKWDQEAMTQSFLLTNICPQNHGLNKEDWNDLEMQCRTWARRYGEVTIVCGPLYQGEAKFIGRNKVQVPSGFFKVVYREKPSKQAIGFIFKNNGSSQPWREQACSVDDVEELTGINFFPQLPDDVEDLIEAEELLREW